ncbi:hypothetical protein Tco_0702571 [Tanacetum coccineum]|uniref:Reverse transcriptase domain-containing protein n=1 Tax=Tanacetum coccineum TaxID=301880 RepID=A0ABQ4XY58_9ASTR
MLNPFKTSIEEPPELELKELPSHLEYAFLEKDNKLPVIISKDLKDDEKVKLIEVLKAHKKPVYKCKEKGQPKNTEVIKKEVIKLLDAGLIYPISDSPWVSQVHCVPKKGGMTVVMNDDNELIPTRLVTGWRVCIDYRKLNDATRKDHFPLPFMDQVESLPSSTPVDQDAPSLSTSQTPQASQSPVTSPGIVEEFHDIEVAHLNNDPFFGIPIPEPTSEESSSRDVITTNVHSVNQPPEYLTKWTKDHPLDNVIGNPSRPVSTRHQLQNEALFCYFDAFLSFVEPNNYKEALKESCWIEAMQE